MRWAVYFIFAYVMLGLQLGVARFIAFHGAGPNLPLLAVLFIALNAPRDAALLGSFTIGLLQDITTAQPPGLFALSYGLVAMLIVGLHHAVNRDHPLTHITLTLIGGLISALVLLVHSWIHPAGAAIMDGSTLLRPVRISASVEFTRVLYTAALAPFVLFALQRIRGAFAFQPQRRKVKWW